MKAKSLLKSNVDVTALIGTQDLLTHSVGITLAALDDQTPFDQVRRLSHE